MTISSMISSPMISSPDSGTFHLVTLPSATEATNV